MAAKVQALAVGRTASGLPIHAEETFRQDADGTGGSNGTLFEVGIDRLRAPAV